jgi:hypothetical protein
MSICVSQRTAQIYYYFSRTSSPFWWFVAQMLTKKRVRNKQNKTKKETFHLLNYLNTSYLYNPCIINRI